MKDKRKFQKKKPKNSAVRMEICYILILVQKIMLMLRQLSQL